MTMKKRKKVQAGPNYITHAIVKVKNTSHVSFTHSQRKAANVRLVCYLMTISVCMTCVVLVTVDSPIPEENWEGGGSQISIHSLMWNVPNPQGLWGLC